MKLDTKNIDGFKSMSRNQLIHLILSTTKDVSKA